MPRPSDQIKLLIERNAAEVTRLHRRIHETVTKRHISEEKREEWKRACEAFHHRYDELAFPGGYHGALDRLVAGDEQAMEAAICFLEVRPYFFRSGYMFKEILRKAKRAPLSAEQSARLQVVVDKFQAWKASKREKRKLDETHG